MLQEANVTKRLPSEVIRRIPMKYSGDHIIIRRSRLKQESPKKKKVEEMFVRYEMISG